MAVEVALWLISQSRPMMRRVFALGCVVLVGFLSSNASAQAEFDEEYDSKRWQEVEVQLPAPPKAESLQSFFVSAASDHAFMVDLSSLTVGGDGVVRYVLVIQAVAGGRNVTFEGIRCESRERRIYAVGRRDGSWTKARNNEWQRIQNQYANRHHAALFAEYFCPGGVIVKNASEASEALKKGLHPMNRQQ